MPPTNAPVQVSQEATQSNQPNERPYLGEKEPKFVIKLAAPIPA